jgi:uncharacterized protein (TIGR02391 family)
MPPVPRLSDNSIERLSKVIANHPGGLTHSEIGNQLKKHGIEDLFTDQNKANRIAKALFAKQQRDACANNVLAFVQSVAEPVRFINDSDKYDAFLAELNMILSFASLMIQTDGMLITVKTARTIDDAKLMASKLRKKLDDRNVHPDVIVCCKTELLRDNNYFHTVLEAAKSVAQKLRHRTRLNLDGHALVDAALCVSKGAAYPLLALNSYSTSSEHNEQIGLAYLVKGMFSMFRNPTAHDLKIMKVVTEDEALEFLVIASLLHRKIDAAHLTNLTPAP